MSEEIIPIIAELVQEIVPTGLVSSKKGDNGIIIVIGGSEIHNGASFLSILTALISGVDLVYTAVPL
jgi:ADP-dependent NAD(P)H-hydrate dehydratase